MSAARARSSARPGPRAVRAVALAAALAAAPASPSAADAAPAEPAPSAPEVRPTALDVAALRTAASLALSPDGTRLAFTVRAPTLDPAAKPSPADPAGGWKVETQLFVAPAAGGERVQLTRGEEAVTAIAWAPDGRRLAFVRKAGAGPRLHLLSLEGGEPAAIDTGDLAPSAPAFTPDGKHLVFLAEHPRAAAERAAGWARGGARRAGTFPATGLHTVPLAGGAPRALTGPDVHVAAFRLSPDGSRAAVLLARSGDPYEASMHLRPALVDARAAGDAAPAPPRWLEDGDGAMEGIAWSPDGRHLAYAKGAGTLTLQNHLVVREADGPGRWNAASALDPTILGFAWTGPATLVAMVAERTGTRLHLLPRTGGSARPLPADGRVASPDGGLSADASGRRLAFLSSTPRSPADPTVVDLATGRSAVVTALNPDAAAWPHGGTEIFRWRNPSGDALEGVLLAPARPSAGPAPLLVLPHGGPDAVSADGFNALAAFLAARGYAVFRPNYRGGTGYGLAFYERNRGRLGAIEEEDVESGVSALVAAGRADPSRLVYGGWSWGGYLATWTLGRVHRYRAAVAGAPVVDVVSQYALSDVNHGAAARWEFLGDPWRAPERFAASNPLHALARARTPTLVLHGEADERVNVSASRILWRALSDLGVETELWLYPREPHVFQEPAHLRHALETWAAWYRRFDPPPAAEVTAARPAP
jgi:dipeptidyl aminopeptidase/acylaminoacyl peptidase